MEILNLIVDLLKAGNGTVVLVLILMYGLYWTDKKHREEKAELKKKIEDLTLDLKSLVARVEDKELQSLKEQVLEKFEAIEFFMEKLSREHFGKPYAETFKNQK